MSSTCRAEPRKRDSESLELTRPTSSDRFLGRGLFSPREEEESDRRRGAISRTAARPGRGGFFRQSQVEVEVPRVVEAVALLASGHAPRESSSGLQLPGELLDLELLVLGKLEDPLAAQEDGRRMAPAHLDRFDGSGRRCRLS